ncbi:hypothetical protein [Erythrobacter sp.]|uniref:hypothetical protein n=1 Tax=Erythrobacter sp. TaxID=1042 RepID=UPI001425FCFE|nr:hypothetical protein [Erythrobacter sp.]QIQ87502.1 MAG: hypothetical protein G9473_13025 [Erythrobacter sp.]
MKVMPFAALLVALAAAQPAFAQDSAEATAPAPAETAVHEGHEGHEGHEAHEMPAALTVDTPIETLMADEAAAAVLETHLPGVGQHPAYDQFKAMSLVQLMPWSQGMITEETLEQITADLAALEDTPAE